jgi:hypothetical protein
MSPRPFENFIFYLYMSLIQGTVSLIMFGLITRIFRMVSYSHIYYSFLAGFCALAPAFFIHVHILRRSPDYFFPSLYNYWIWQLNLSIVMNLYINHIKKKDLEAQKMQEIN